MWLNGRTTLSCVEMICTPIAILCPDLSQLLNIATQQVDQNLLRRMTIVCDAVRQVVVQDEPVFGVAEIPAADQSGDSDDEVVVDSPTFNPFTRAETTRIQDSLPKVWEKFVQATHQKYYNNVGKRFCEALPCTLQSRCYTVKTCR